MHIHMRAALLAGAALLAESLWAQPLTLDQAVGRAIAASPELRAGEAGVDAARADQLQARVRPNPTVSVDMENAAGTGGYGLFRQSELTVTYAQPLERGGKREARMAYAERGVVLAEAQWRVVRLDIAQQVQRAYIDVQIAEQLVWIGEDRVKLEKEMRSEAVRRVRGYKDPLFVETRADARITEAELALKEAVAKRQSARALLVSFWGGTVENLTVAEGIEKPDPRDPALAEADAAVFDAAVDQARARVVVEKSRAVQDVTVSGGTRFLRDTNDVALVGAQEPVEQVRVLAHHRLHQQRDARAGGGQVVEGAHRHVDLVADATDVDQHGRGVLFEERSAQSSDHAADGTADAAGRRRCVMRAAAGRGAALYAGLRPLAGLRP